MLQHKGQANRPRMQNGLDQKAQGVPNEDFESSYMHTANVNQVTVILILGLLVFSWTDSAKIEIFGIIHIHS